MITSALYRAADWAKSVFSSAALGDPRRTARLVNVAAQLAKYSGKSITISSDGSEAVQEGAYRFIRNPNVSAEAIRKAGAMQRELDTHVADAFAAAKERSGAIRITKA